ncbi:MAG: Ig-like domain-containing protein [Thiomonas sp.]|nr:Ig-like domain-containing protein [Thiomonas sp.]
MLRGFALLATALLCCAVARAGSAIAVPAQPASGVSRLAAPGFRFANPSEAAAQTADNLQLLSPIGLPVSGIVKATGALAVIEPAAPLSGCTTYTLQRKAPAQRSVFTTTCSPWSAPVQIDDARSARLVDLPANGVQVAAADDGAFVAVWFQDEAGRRAILASRFNADTQTWSPPRAIDQQGPQAGASGIPAIAADPQGRVTVAWFQLVNGRDAIFATQWQGEAWTPPQRLDSPALPGNATNPQLAADAAGNVTVVWQQPDGRHTGIYAAHWVRAQRRWLAARRLDRLPTDAYSPVVAATPGGRVVAAWQQGPSGREAVYAVASQASGAHWTAPARISPAGAAATSPALIATSQGAVMAAWTQGRTASRRIAVCQWPGGAGSQWSAVQLLQSPAFTGPAASPALAADAAGNVTLAWAQQNGARREAMLAVRRLAASPGWTAPQQIDDPALRSAGNPVLAVDAAGNVRCAWYQDGPQGMQVQAARYNPSQHQWSAPEQLSDPEATVMASFPALAINPAGSVMAVWQQFNGWRTIVEARWLP